MFDERQIYRIDHYLGKETVQNILVLRFANSIFEPLFNQKYIDHVQITVAEEEGVGTRAGYYEQAGALRDMVQNHMLQLLSLVAMEPPHSLDADVVRDEKLEVLQSLRPLQGDAVDANVVRAQYDRRLTACRLPRDQGVDSDIAHRDLRRAAGVHRQLALGRRAVLPAHRQAAAEARQRDLDPPEGGAADPVQRRSARKRLEPNVLSIRIQPDEGFSLGISCKLPGPHVRHQAGEDGFPLRQQFGGSSPEAYERLLLDVMAGDPTLFMRRDAVEAAWRWVMPILERWADDSRCRSRPMPPARGDRPKPTV